MNVDERMRLVTRNTQDVLVEGELRNLLTKKKAPAVYLGTAITGRPHIAYFTWVLKLADFLKAGFKVKLLLADIHGALDNTPWDVLEKRYAYYSAVMPLMFEAIGADIKNFEIVRGSSFQTSEKYMLDLLKLSTQVSVHDANKAASEVVKLGKNPRLGGLLYPLMQALDEEYLDVDVQYGGVDQRKILVFARESLPKMGYKPRVEIMTPLIPGLQGAKMSASDEKSKIDLLDSDKDVQKKVNKAFAEPGTVEGNGILAFIKHVVFPIKEDNNEEFLIERPEKYGGDVKYVAYEDLEKDYVAEKLSPPDLKIALTKEINVLLKPFRTNAVKLQKLSEAAY